MEYRIHLTDSGLATDDATLDRTLTALTTAAPNLGPVLTISDGRVEVVLAIDAGTAPAALSEATRVADAALATLGTAFDLEHVEIELVRESAAAA